MLSFVIGFSLVSVSQQQPPQGPAPHQQLTDDQAVALATRNAQATINWDKSSSTGMKADMLLLQKGMVKGQLRVMYKMRVTGAPHDQRYKLMSWPVTMSDPVEVMDGLAIDQNGSVICPANSAASCSHNFDGAEIKMTFAPAKGEIYRSALISRDEKARVFFSIVPDPIIVKDGTCSLELVRLSPNFELVLIRAAGFPPSDNVAFHSRSYDEVHDANVKADAQGEFWVPFTPVIKDKTSGRADVTAKGSRCAPTLSFDWGAGQ